MKQELHFKNYKKIAIHLVDRVRPISFLGSPALLLMTRMSVQELNTPCVFTAPFLQAPGANSGVALERSYSCLPLRLMKPQNCVLLGICRKSDAPSWGSVLGLSRTRVDIMLL